MLNAALGHHTIINKIFNFYISLASVSNASYVPPCSPYNSPVRLGSMMTPIALPASSPLRPTGRLRAHLGCPDGIRMGGCLTHDSIAPLHPDLPPSRRQQALLESAPSHLQRTTTLSGRPVLKRQQISGSLPPRVLGFEVRSPLLLLLLSPLITPALALEEAEAGPS